MHARQSFGLGFAFLFFLSGEDWGLVRSCQIERDTVKDSTSIEVIKSKDTAETCK